MKIFQINCVYKDGSTGKIMYDFHASITKFGFDSYVCYGRGKRYKEKNCFRISNDFFGKINKFGSFLSGYLYGGALLATRRVIRIINKIKPDIVIFWCANGYFVNLYKIISYLGSHDVKTIFVNHAEFYYTGNCGHSLECDKWKIGCGHCPIYKKEIGSIFDNTAKSWTKMFNAFHSYKKANIAIVSTSPWTKSRAMTSPILKDFKHVVIYNGIDTSIFRYLNVCNQTRHGFKKVVFHPTSYFQNDINSFKGGYYVVELAKKMPDVLFVVAGMTIGELPELNNLHFVGRISDQTVLARYYNDADLTLLVSKKETFSMITVESLCCGTPVVGFKAGAPELIALEEYSSFVDFGNVSELERIMSSWLLKELDKEKISNEAIGSYSKEVMTRKYIELIESLSSGDFYDGL